MMSFCTKYVVTLNNSKVRFCTLCQFLHQKRYISFKNPHMENQDKSDMKKDNHVIKKYEKMLLNVSKNDQDSTFEYATNFGSVRFDNDITFNNGFESDLIKKTTPISKNDRRSIQNATDLNYVDDVYFKDSISSLESEDYVAENNGNMEYKKFKVPEDLNEIDSQYIVMESNSYPEADTKNSKAALYEDQCCDNLISELTFNFEDSINMEDTVTNNAPLEMRNRSNNEDEIIERMEDLLKETSRIFPERKRYLLKNVTKSELKANETQENSKEIKNEVLSESNKSDSTDSSKLSNKDSLGEFNSSNVETTSGNNFENEYSMSAYDFVKKRRKDESLATLKEVKSEVNPSEKFKRIIIETPSFSHLTQHDMVHFLKRSILYNKNDILALFKPYGVPVHGGGFKGERFNLNDLLPSLASLLKIDKLHLVHRLDMHATGVILLAKSDAMAEKLKLMFKKQLIRKTYLAITKNIPKALNGIIDIPVGTGKIDGIERMVLRPDVDGFRGRPGHSKKALTKYRVLSRSNSASLLEVNPITGAKHQIRVHLGFGIDCPVLGDHKYSHLLRMAPQKLAGDTLEAFGMKQSKVRHLPLHLHAFIVNIPGLGDNNSEITIKVGPPKYFKTSLRILKLSSRKNRLIDDYSDIVHGY